MKGICSECQFEPSKFMSYEYTPHAPGCSRANPTEGEREIYRGCEIHAYRDNSMSGDEMLFYSVFAKEGKGLELSSGFYTGNESPKEYLEYLKNTVDDYILNPQDYD